jgi:hypothetical protein
MAAGATYTTLATTTLSSAQSSVTFSSISGTYTDLVLVVSTISVNGTAYMTVNSDTGTNYSRTFMYGTGSSVASARTTNFASYPFTVGSVSGTFSASIVHLMNYSNSTTYKTFLTRGNDAADATVALVGLWRNTNAITSINLATASGNFNTGSTFTLYGIAAA